MRSEKSVMAKLEYPCVCVCVCVLNVLYGFAYRFEGFN